MHVGCLLSLLQQKSNSLFGGFLLLFERVITKEVNSSLLELSVFSIPYGEFSCTTAGSVVLLVVVLIAWSVFIFSSTATMLSAVFVFTPVSFVISGILSIYLSIYPSIHPSILYLSIYLPMEACPLLSVHG